MPNISVSDQQSLADELSTRLQNLVQAHLMLTWFISQE